ncbi:3-phytase [Pseudomonas cuatrocienegasensis]|uniref:3-phytase n=1 Tax=Pseudomonas cuatrocienegasensis TaxID=543360 RepID=A0ABY1BJ18_9PSED|nr:MULTISPECIES: phytase [Pseudomonas]OEC34593.1 3-phytase [Pseudomonas sp. 21C1]SEQ97172.1 3-phytase [Pseudomonas cuatrocienegasensis]
MHLSFVKKNLLLASLIALSACQSTVADKPAAALSLQALASPDMGAVEAAQWLASDSFWPGAERLQSSEKKGLFVLDGQGATLSQLPGTFASIDHRVGPRGLLVAALDVDRQQAMLVNLANQRWGEPLYLPRPAYKIDGLCLYRDAAHNEFVFLIGEEGIGEQWLVAQNEVPLATPKRVRGMSLPPASEYCQVDDLAERLYVNEENVGLWAYAAHAEADLVREPVGLVQPFGDIGKALAGMAVVPGGVLALDPESNSLHRYQRSSDGWQAQPVLPLGKLNEPEGLSVRAVAGGLELLVRDDDGLQHGQLAWQAQAPEPHAALPILPVQVQTDPVPSLGDAADDPAIWVHPSDPRKSRVLGTDKQGGLLAYDLAGKQLQDLRLGRMNNVDVRAGFDLNGERVDLAVASNRDQNSLQLFAIDRRSGELRNLGKLPTPLKDIYGLCMFKDAAGAIYAIPNDKDGTFLQYRLSADDGRIRGELVRQFKVASQPEGCVADDRNQRLFVGEEDVAVWALDARAEAPTQLEQVIAVGDVVHDDIEGLAIYQGATRDYLVISSQGNDSYVVLDAAAPYAVRGAFRIGLNAQLGIDGASETDGLDVTSANLGGIWSAGMLVVQDGRKRMPEDRQNYKYLPWSAVAEALGLE